MRLNKKMSKVCFINPDSLNVTPYFSQYLDCYQDDYDLVYWDRGIDPKEGKPGEHIYHYPLTARNPLLRLAQLAKGYFGFRQFAQRILRQEKYDRVVALTGNTGAILNKVLAKDYTGSYLVDVRDYFLEKLPPYWRMERRALDNAAFVVASSPAYTAFLENRPLQIMHNDTSGSLMKELAALAPLKHENAPLVLASIGTLKDIEIDKQIIHYFLNDPRFELRFLGRGYEQLEGFIQELGATNVIASGEFDARKTASLYKDVGAILNIYGNQRMHVKYLLPNKLYIAARTQKPIIVSEDTYLAEVIEDYDLGLALDFNDSSCKERILRLYDANQVEARRKGAESFIEKVEQQNEKTKAMISQFLNG